MQKLLFRMIVLIFLFIGSLIFFVASMKENSLTREIETTEMSDVSLPVVSVLYQNKEMNFLYGYVKDTVTYGAREEITPVPSDGDFFFYLYPYENEIVSVEYEINNRAEKIVIETGEGKVEPLSASVKKRKLNIHVAYSFSPEVEYGMKLILINKDGKKTYYYTTLKYLKEDRFEYNYNFAKRFEKAIFEKKEEKFVRRYLETNPSMDNMSFEHVNISSSYDMITWGDLAPQKVTEPQIRVLEHNRTSTGLLYQYVVSVGVKNKNYYNVTEFFRINSYDSAVYLLAYDRRMEEVFHPEKTSLSKKQLKFGIGNKNTDFMTSVDNKYISFVREREVWQYETENNVLSKVFAFRKNNFDSERENLDRHRIKLLRMENGGDFFFAVYGYMNRGVYEGRNGVVIYKYYEKEKRVEELVFILADKFHKELIHDIDRVSYLSADGVFYFALNGTFYSYSLAKRKLDTVTDEIKDDLFLVLHGGREVAWQDTHKDNEIWILNLETRHKAVIRSEEGKRLQLFTSIDNNLIYGVIQEKDIRKSKDGSLILPSEKLLIVDASGNPLKEYFKEKYYVTGVQIEDSVIFLKRLKKNKEGEFVVAATDQILNNNEKKLEEVAIVDRRTEKYLTEYYLTLPKAMDLKELPNVYLDVKNTVIPSETTVKFSEEMPLVNRYYAIVYGRVLESSENPAPMIALANKGMGYVIDSFGIVIWERGKMKQAAVSEEIDIDYADEADSEKEAAIRLFLTAKGIYISDSELKNGKSILEIVLNQPEIKALNLNGISLEEALYYVSEGSPVIAMMDNRLVLITAYQSRTVSLMNVITGKIEVMSREEAEKIFEQAGNRFISAIG